MRLPLIPEIPAGGAYPRLSTSEGWTNVVRYLPMFPAAGTSYWYGHVTIGGDYAIGNPIRLRLANNASGGNVRVEVALQSTGDGANSDSAYTPIAAQTIAMPATAKQLVTATFAIPAVLFEGQTLNFRIARYGDDAAESGAAAAATLALYDAHLDTA